MAFREDLAQRAAAREPAALEVTDPPAETLTALVRADSDSFQWAPLGGRAGFTWTVSLTAADPRVYGQWREATLKNTGETYTGRRYDRAYPWRYGESVTPNAVVLDNPGNAPAPVFALFTGRLQAGYITDGTRQIRMREIPEGVQILVNTETLAASAEGGATRASYIQPGSQPMVLAPHSQTRWTLQSSQEGNVVLSWRPAWT
jgi:hypothetical protein